MSSEKYEMLAKTFAGLEDVLKAELEEIGATDLEVVNRGVKFSGSKEILYRANFCCRTALRVLWIIGEYKVKNANDLYQSVYKIDWSQYFNVDQTFSINSTVNSEAFNNSMFVSLKAKDAIVDQFRSTTGKRPSVNAENPDIRINVHASSDEFTISLDSSGESLHKRGYRLGQNEASMSEVLAAGILKIAGWNGQCDFYDGMCGSGTIPIEAALIARNIQPGIFRKSFGFESFKNFDADLLEEIYNDDYEKPFEHTIYASDISVLSVKIAEKNGRSAGLKSEVVFRVQDFAELVPTNKDSMLIINPPYGERMNDRKVEPIYNMIGTSLKRNFIGCNTWIFSGSDDGLKNIGLRSSQRISLYNGPIECSLRQFEMFDGKQKDFKERQSFRNDNESQNDRRGDFNPRNSRPDSNSSDRPKFERRDRRDDSRGDRNPSEFRGDRNRGDFKPDRKPGEFSPNRRTDSSGGARRSEGFRGERTGDSQRPRRSDSAGGGERRSEGGYRSERTGDSQRPRRTDSTGGGERRSEGYRSERSGDSQRPRRSDSAGGGERRSEGFRGERTGDSQRPRRSDDQRSDGRSFDRDGSSQRSNAYQTDKPAFEYLNKKPKTDPVEILSSELKHTDKKGVFQPKEEKTKTKKVEDGKVKRRRI